MDLGGRARHRRGAAAEAASRKSGEDHDGTLACFHPAPFYFRLADDGTEEAAPDQRYAGLLRIARNVTGEVVAHECTHAALSAYRHHHELAADLGDDCGPLEESLAYLVGQFTGGVTNRLHALGIW